MKQNIALLYCTVLKNIVLICYTVLFFETPYIFLFISGISNAKAGATVEGYDMIMWVNHFGPFLLTHLLLDKLKESAPSRIITVSSSAHSAIKNEQDFFYIRQKTAPPGTGTLKTYGQTKVANIIFMRDLAKKLDGTGVTTYSLHPGYVQTDNIQNNIATAENMLQTLKFRAASILLW